MFLDNITFLDAAKPIGVGALATQFFPNVAVSAGVGPAGTMFLWAIGVLKTSAPLSIVANVWGAIQLRI